MPKHTDDKAAREVAEALVTFDDADPQAIVALFPVAEFEAITKGVAGETVMLRRVVLVGPWEVVK